jgi:hypothetical protein
MYGHTTDAAAARNPTTGAASLMSAMSSTKTARAVHINHDGTSGAASASPAGRGRWHGEQWSRQASRGAADQAQRRMPRERSRRAKDGARGAWGCSSAARPRQTGQWPGGTGGEPERSGASSIAGAEHVHAHARLRDGLPVQPAEPACLRSVADLVPRAASSQQRAAAGGGG